MAPYSSQKSIKIDSKIDSEKHHLFYRVLHRFSTDFGSIWDANLDPKASPWKGGTLVNSPQRCAWQPEPAQTTKIDPTWKPPTPKILPKWIPKRTKIQSPTSHLGWILAGDFLNPPTKKSLNYHCKVPDVQFGMDICGRFSKPTHKQIYRLLLQSALPYSNGNPRPSK